MDGLVQKTRFHWKQEKPTLLASEWGAQKHLRQVAFKQSHSAMRRRSKQTLQLREHNEPSTLPENSSVTCNHISPNPGDLHYTSQEGDQHKNHFYKAYEN